METPVALLLELGLVLLALVALGGTARRAGLSPAPLYLLAGVALGEGSPLALPASEDFVDGAAAVGLVLLLLALGLEFSAEELTSSVQRHLPSAVVDGVLNAGAGALVGVLLGLGPVQVLALAGATWVSSSGIVSRLLGDLQRLGNRETPAVLSVLVLEDVAMAVYLPVLAVAATGGSPTDALLGVAVALGALAVAFTTSRRWGHHVGRVVGHPDPEQLLLRVLALTLVVAALAESLHVSAAVGAFLVGLTLAGDTAERARDVLAPLRDLFAALFFLAIGLSLDAGALLPAVPAALALAAVTALTKIATGAYAAARDGVRAPGRVRAGTALVVRGEFSLVVLGLVGAAASVEGSAGVALGPLIGAYVLVLAVVGPLLTRYADRLPSAWTLRLPGGR